MLCSCTAEPKTDLIGFCNRVNKRSEQMKLDDSAYYSDGENEYCYYITLSGKDCILALITDSDYCVNAVRLTTVNDGTAVDGKALLDYYLTLCSVLTNKSVSELSETLGGFSPDFNDSTVEAEGERYTCFIYTNEQIISLYCAVT